ncbi:HNH endonuclease [Xylanimonas allomyrinae]|uniref:HNH endonuclease n=1 Tax=Xylanimonas allomyrinae TaxID=2509459 RepID=A0A4P6EM45_9MICO|nr:HNH endonuclease signature motif containing protein [Xylanimonas allomyrinae]QAY63752.1 HNH endonuclease [Xylanimonas allomyrinae]
MIDTAPSTANERPVGASPGADVLSADALRADVLSADALRADVLRADALRAHQDEERASFRDLVRQRAAALARAGIADDGSLASRLWDQPDLVDALLGRAPIDPLGAGSDARGLPADAAALVDVRGAVGIDDLDATLDAVAAARAQVNAWEAVEALLLERARRQALRAEAVVLDDGDSQVRAAGAVRRGDLARRAVVSEIALAIHQDEHAVAVRAGCAQALVERAPQTLAGALAGRVAWRNATKVADAVAELDLSAAARLDELVAHHAARQSPQRFARTVRRVRESVHATPAEVRHAEAATKRGVWIDRAADGMAYLTLCAPAPAVHAIGDRIETVGRAARADGDARTLAQLRADVACALLLDDGTLDLASAASVAACAGSRQGGASGAGADLDGGDAVGADDDGTRAGSEPFGRTGFSLATVARSVRPKIYVTVPVLTLLGRADEPAMLDGSVPIDPETARELAGLATSFTRLLTHPENGAVLAVGSSSYRPPADLRHYLKVRDVTCRFPGCARPASAADADHTIARADGGGTHAGNLAELCRRHHVLKHQSRFTVSQSAVGDGTLTWTTPTGRTYVTRPDPVPATVHRTPDPGDEPPDWGDPPF